VFKASSFVTSTSSLRHDLFRQRLKIISKMIRNSNSCCMNFQCYLQKSSPLLGRHGDFSFDMSNDADSFGHFLVVSHIFSFSHISRLFDSFESFRVEYIITLVIIFMSFCMCNHFRIAVSTISKLFREDSSRSESMISGHPDRFHTTSYT
jgi:hypothetical protein